MPNGKQERPAQRGKGLLSGQRPKGAGGAPVQASENPFRPYHGAGEAVGPYLSSPKRPLGYRAPYPAPPAMTADIADLTAHHSHPFALFHDGNAGHLWRGAVASMLGDTLLATGVMMWLYAITDSSVKIALAVLALAFPVLLAIPLSVPLQNAPEPGVPLKWLGRLRVVCTLGFVVMHFFVDPQTTTPAFVLLFVLSLLGRLRAGARVAAERTCLAPGEVEAVSSDLHVGSALAAVLGPLLGAALFIVGGSHVLFIAIGAVVCYLLSANSEGFLDALPPERRAYLHARPLPAPVEDAETEDEEDETGNTKAGRTGKTRFPSANGGTAANPTPDHPEDPALLRERRLPVWYVQGPQTIGQGISDIFGGLRVASTSRGGAASLSALTLLAFVGSGLTTILLPYLVLGLGLSIFELGPLLAAEGAGLAISAYVVGGSAERVKPAARLALGFLGSGVGLLLLAFLRIAPLIYLGGLVYGLAGGCALLTARQVLLAKRTGPEQRAIGTGEEMVTTLAGVFGAAVFPLFTFGASVVHLGPLARFFPGWPLVDTVLGTAVALIAAGALFLVLLSRKPKEKQATTSTMDPATRRRAALARNGDGTVGHLFAQEGGADDEDGHGLSRPRPAGNLWRDDDDVSSYGPATGYETGYETGYRGGSSRRDDYDDDDADDTGYGSRRPGRR